MDYIWEPRALPCHDLFVRTFFCQVEILRVKTLLNYIYIFFVFFTLPRLLLRNEEIVIYFCCKMFLIL